LVPLPPTRLGQGHLTWHIDPASTGWRPLRRDRLHHALRSGQPRPGHERQESATTRPTVEPTTLPAAQPRRRRPQQRRSPSRQPRPKNITLLVAGDRPLFEVTHIPQQPTRIGGRSAMTASICRVMTRDTDGQSTFAVYGPNRDLVWLCVHAVGGSHDFASEQRAAARPPACKTCCSTPAFSCPAGHATCRSRSPVPEPTGHYGPPRSPTSSTEPCACSLVSGERHRSNAVSA
jgi:hypothetical protein